MEVSHGGDDCHACVCRNLQKITFLGYNIRKLYRPGKFQWLLRWKDNGAITEGRLVQHMLWPIEGPWYAHLGTGVPSTAWL